MTAAVFKDAIQNYTFIAQWTPEDPTVGKAAGVGV